MKEEESVCLVCDDAFKQNEGVVCTNRHFVCSGCFGEYAKSAGEPGAVSKAFDEHDGLRCCGCDDFYDLRALHDSPAAFLSLLALLDKMKEQKARAAGVEQERIFAEQQKALDEATRLSNDIVENQLNLRCPRCLSAFDDFIGCFALSCANNACQAAICAWCLADCGRDAHAHVLQCAQGNGQYYGDMKDFNARHNARRGKLVRERLEILPHALRMQVFRNIRVALAGLDIRFDDLEVAADEAGRQEAAEEMQRAPPPFPIQDVADPAANANDGFFAADNSALWDWFFEKFPEHEVRLVAFLMEVDDDAADRRDFLKQDDQAWQHLVEFVREYGHWG